METAAISHRVADFLKQYPPFQAMEDGDLLNLARGGRVRFFEANEYILWQGASRHQVFVIQQGTVSLWDEQGADAKLCDVRGAGDLLGIDQFNDSRSYLFSARSASDVLVYVFPADEFANLVLKYPYAKKFVAAYGSVTAEYRSSEEWRDPDNVFLHSVVAGKKLSACDGRSSIREVARQMLATGADAVVVLDSEQRAQAILTPMSFLEWIEKGTLDAREPVATLIAGAPPSIAADLSVTHGVLAMAAANECALVLTSDGTSSGRVHGLVTSQDLGQVFGDQPVEILREIRCATDTAALRQLNHRARAFALRYLTSASSSDWLAGFTSTIDANILRKIIAMEAPTELRACWCFSGSSGRGESLTRLAPTVAMIMEDGQDPAASLDTYQRVLNLLGECDYLPTTDRHFEAAFYSATLAEWKERYFNWVRAPVFNKMYLARPLFDLRPIHGLESLWKDVEDAVTSAVNREFLFVLANDCLASLPPLTFFQNAVVDETGAETSIFRLEHSALGPLVDVGRVFGMAARNVMGRSTLERFAMARTLLPDHASIFREASEMLRIVLWLQARVGISQGTSGSELPPALLSRYDRQILRTGFRSILRLLEFTADLQWLNTL